MTLPYDLSRCQGDYCARRAECARWVKHANAELRLLPAARHLCETPEFEAFLPAEAATE